MDLILRHFDEDYYLRNHHDLWIAKEHGMLKSPLKHYMEFGHNEGRRIVRDFDADWYVRTYPAAQEEMESLSIDAYRHFVRLGVSRGYLPNRSGERATLGPLPESRFGGLWTDSRMADDLRKGKFAIGQFDSMHNDLLAKWIADGYVVLPEAIPENLLDLAQEKFESAFSGNELRCKFESYGVGKGVISWDERLRSHASKGLDFHWLFEEYRDLVFSPQIREFIRLVFEAPLMASQSLSFFRGSSQQAHQDWAYVTYCLPNHFAASWIALEDVKIPAGELFYYRGSQRLPETLFGSNAKSPSEAKRQDPDYRSETDAKTYVDNLASRCLERGMQQEVFIAKRGQVLIWSANLVHGGKPVSAENSRKSVVTHYCPAYVAPLYFESRNCSVRKHDSDYYTTAIY